MLDHVSPLRQTSEQCQFPGPAELFVSPILAPLSGHLT